MNSNERHIRVSPEEFVKLMSLQHDVNPSAAILSVASGLRMLHDEASVTGQERIEILFAQILNLCKDNHVIDTRRLKDGQWN